MTTMTKPLSYLDPTTFPEIAELYGTVIELEGETETIFSREHLQEIAGLIVDAFPAKQWVLAADDLPGPRQVSAYEKAVSAMRSDEWYTIEVKGTEGRPETYERYSMTMMIGGGPRLAHPAISEAVFELGEEFDWTLSRSNARHVVARAKAYAVELRGARKFLEDHRQTVEEVEAHEASIVRMKAQTEEREASRVVDSMVAKSIAAKAPLGATALIVAELHENNSDLMTDYFAHRTTRTVAIGWRTGSRESFPQLRKAAGQFKETSHLGVGRDVWTVRALDPDNTYDSRLDEGFETEEDLAARVEELISECAGKTAPYVVEFGDLAAQYGWEAHCESLEHRENYSMGGGNYLKAGGRHDSGWCVSSIPLGSAPNNIEDGLPAEAEAGSVDYEVVSATNTKGDFWLCVPVQRMERSDFEAERARAKAAGGWYSRKYGRQEGGFGFALEVDARGYAG